MPTKEEERILKLLKTKRVLTTPADSRGFLAPSPIGVLKSMAARGLVVVSTGSFGRLLHWKLVQADPNEY
jgi:hypothetical protein